MTENEVAQAIEKLKLLSFADLKALEEYVDSSGLFVSERKEDLKYLKILNGELYRRAINIQKDLLS